MTTIGPVVGIKRRVFEKEVNTKNKILDWLSAIGLSIVMLVVIAKNIQHEIRRTYEP